MNLPPSFYILYHDFGRHGIGVVGDLVLTEAEAVNAILETSKESPSMLIYPDRWKCLFLNQSIPGETTIADRTLPLLRLAYTHQFKESPPWE